MQRGRTAMRCREAVRPFRNGADERQGFLFCDNKKQEHTSYLCSDDAAGTSEGAAAPAARRQTRPAG